MVKSWKIKEHKQYAYFYFKYRMKLFMVQKSQHTPRV